MKKGNLLKVMNTALMIVLIAVYSNAQNAEMDVMQMPESANIEIDGSEADWPNNIEYIDLTQTINKVESMVSTDPKVFASTPFGTSDLSAYMRVAWDQEFFYLFVYVDDDVDANQGGKDWQSDNIEVFFNVDLGNDLPYDGDNKNYTGSDGKTDAIQFRFARNTELFPEAGPGWIIRGWTNMEYVVDNTTSTTSYTLETKIPFDSLFTDHTNIGDWVPNRSPLGLTPEVGHQMGFEVQVADYDGTESTYDDYNRDGFLLWSNESGNDLSHRNTGLFGTITLSDKVAALKKLPAKNISVFPTLVDNMLYIQSKNIERIQILNVVGQQVKLIQDVKPQMNLDISDLTKGMYIVNFVKGNAVFSKKIIKK